MLVILLLLLASNLEVLTSYAMSIEVAKNGRQKYSCINIDINK